MQDPHAFFRYGRKVMLSNSKYWSEIAIKPLMWNCPGQYERTCHSSYSGATATTAISPTWSINKVNTCGIDSCQWFLIYHSNAHWHTVAIDIITPWTKWHFTLQLISAWHGPEAHKTSEGEAVLKCFVIVSSAWLEIKVWGMGLTKAWESIKNKESPHDQLSEKRVQNTSNSTFHLLKIETERKHNSCTALARFDPTLVMYSFSALMPMLSNINI